MIDPETHVQIRRYFYAEHWKIGTIAPQHNWAFTKTPCAMPSRPTASIARAKPCGHTSSILIWSSYGRTLDQHPRLRTTRIYQMIQDRGYTGSVVQLRRAVARLRPTAREPFLKLQAFPAEHYGKFRVMVRSGAVRSF